MTTHSIQFKNHFTRDANIELPIIGGPMYPCSNPELVAAVSEAGGIGIVQPLSLTYVHGYDFRQGLQYIRSLTSKPIGINADIALEEGIRFFITSLGKPGWVVERVHEVGGVVYHDVTETKWADKAVEANVDGLISVNNRAGGHTGNLSAQTLYDKLSSYNLPLICAGGISTATDFKQALEQGYAGVQMGTRLIATTECNATLPYKQAIVNATEKDIVLSERVSGTPVSLINTPYVDRLGLKPNVFQKWMLHSKLKYVMRTLFVMKSFWKLKQAVLDKTGKIDYWQAGKSVAGITKIESIKDIISRFRNVINNSSSDLKGKNG